jgi:hypothetical protein
MFFMSSRNESINSTSVVDLMILDDHDAVFNPYHARTLVIVAWTSIAFIVVGLVAAVYLVAAPAYELYTQSVPGASNVMLSFIIAGFVAIFAVDLAANTVLRHNSGAQLVKIAAN